MYISVGTPATNDHSFLFCKRDCEVEFAYTNLYSTFVRLYILEKKCSHIALRKS